MIRFNYPRMTFTIALVLGEITERSFFQSMGISDGDWTIFFTRTVALILVVMCILTLLIPSIRAVMERRTAVKSGAHPGGTT
jgi:putative tricarboxylic transport membrane protein